MTRHRPALRTALPGKHRLPSAIDPAEHAFYVRTRHTGATLTHLAGAVLVHQNSLLRHALAAHPDAQLLTGWSSADLHLLRHRDHDVALCSGIGAGAPATALVIEQLTALGVPAIVSIGTAASLIPTLGPGDIVLCEKALRGEGTSGHYLRPSLFAHPEPQLTTALSSELSAIGATWSTGPSWTTDALYRESTTEAVLYAGHGILTVEMEAAGAFAVGQRRHLPVAAAFAIADCLVNRAPRTDSPHTGNALRQLLTAALNALTAHGPPPDNAPIGTGMDDHDREQAKPRG
ncbi:nucleoside phosphorylase [Streptomyces seoulensis]|uniref:nucleoside phosphorylase n=1 Tax=Streptomyces seoulensis TaxID=73044 RepID=UPI001FCBB3FD|nr:nucleoside phosphorylase [Streptomyces seoulensis]BDH07155.1 hypothetical protein HEK131_43820 [Streptomyces seoulensis]